MRKGMRAALGLALVGWLAAGSPAPARACSVPLVRVLQAEVRGLPSGIRVQKTTRQRSLPSEPFQVLITNDSQASVRVVERNEILVDVAPGSSGLLPVTVGPHFLRLEQGKGQWPIDLSYAYVADPDSPCDIARRDVDPKAWANAIAPGLEGDAERRAMDAHVERMALADRAERRAAEAQRQRELVELGLKASLGIALLALLIGRRLARRPTMQ